MSKSAISITISIVIVAVALLAGYFYFTGKNYTNEVTFADINGVGYSQDGKRLIIPTADGFRIYENRSWSIPDLPKHNFIGYSPVDIGFYSSGQAAPQTGQTSALGLVKSTDEGKTLQPLGFAGEPSFQVIGVGYSSHTIVVFNDKPRSSMDVGLFISSDDAKSWTKANASGLQGTPTSIAVHPTDKAILLVGTDQGLYLSDSTGESFDMITNPFPITSVLFEPNGNRILVAGKNKEQGVTVFEIDLMNGGAEREITIPKLGEDVVQHMAINPQNGKELILVTNSNSILLSSDNGNTWTKVNP
ncbi:WD40/YVTN/BNR-like repeat-containing protein [Brevibacillus sp. SYSU BS000544]|uniref:WD40/YVTN/BNR-like repeat-containing protein n=1 Tax=Brevibacillus sp. SYSU BS000544 TaxID=3416443 RepID=UPI003CE4C45F